MRAALLVAQSLHRARDRNHSARVPRSCDHLQRRRAVPAGTIIHGILSRVQNTSIAGQGFARAAGSAAPELGQIGVRKWAATFPPTRSSDRHGHNEQSSAPIRECFPVAHHRAGAHAASNTDVILFKPLKDLRTVAQVQHARCRIRQKHIRDVDKWTRQNRTEGRRY
jgi:hypothetical protein